ncbi:hypothetical protein SCHPADRAFT_264252 [Schizopora paradoxa]|uniref:HIT-type domain-containing protein n=1 Tax=Schizopora paradoxa TaxID=27342 RepID=A0A0H2RU22_9AGAM|nr:hypothetical protein SCHPADRAFT_264252 [Schizopora paradoxa]
MPPRRANCQICNDSESKYACPKCEVLYCSVTCYKTHRLNSCAGRGEVGASGESKNPLLPELGGSSSLSTQEQSRLDEGQQPGTSKSSEGVDHTSQDVNKGQQRHQQEGIGDQMEETMPTKVPLRALTTLKWPYIPEAPSYPDPLARDDPKSLSLAQYEGIATSLDVRKALSQNPNLPRILRALDSLRGTHREETLQRVLGVSREAQGIGAVQRNMYIPAAGSAPGFDEEGAPEQSEFIGDEERKALKVLAEAIEAAVRARVDRPEPVSFGLEWEDSGER